MENKWPGKGKRIHKIIYDFRLNPFHPQFVGFPFLFCICSLSNQFGDTSMNDRLNEMEKVTYTSSQHVLLWIAKDTMLLMGMCCSHIQVLSLSISRDEIVIFEQQNIDTRFIYDFENDS